MMIFTETKIRGAFLVELDRREDDRGWFGRAFCQHEFAAAGLAHRVAQVNRSANTYRGTLRGMHFQAAPCQEAKVVMCTRGALYDVVLDLRDGSPTLGSWAAAELTGGNGSMLYIPEGCAHGFQTLTDDTEVLYLMSAFYSPEHGRGVRYDDPSFRIEWPLPVTSLSAADRAWPDFGRPGNTNGGCA
jgi:dTDP-4-dehydrorhamnose 3,5-epimerase